MHGFLHLPLAVLCVLFAAHLCVLLACLLRVLQPEAGAPTPALLLATGQARQGTHTKPEVGAPNSLPRQVGRPNKGS